MQWQLNRQDTDLAIERAFRYDLKADADGRGLTLTAVQHWDFGSLHAFRKRSNTGARYMAGNMPNSTGPDDQEDQKNPGGDTINPTGVSVTTPPRNSEAKAVKKAGPDKAD